MHYKLSIHFSFQHGTCWFVWMNEIYGSCTIKSKKKKTHQKQRKTFACPLEFPTSQIKRKRHWKSWLISAWSGFQDMETKIHPFLHIGSLILKEAWHSNNAASKSKATFRCHQISCNFIFCWTIHLSFCLKTIQWRHHRLELCAHVNKADLRLRL